MNIPTIDTLTPAMLAAIAGAVVSLIFQFVPGASDWFARLMPAQKQLFMLGVMLAVAIVISIYTFAQQGFTWSAMLTLLLTIYAALTANQVTYQFIKTAH
jgi:hypothetical protein